MNAPVIVYTKDACYACDATKKYMTKHNVLFETRSVSELTEEQMRGHMQAPVVIPPVGESWSGFNPTRIRELVR